MKNVQYDVAHTQDQLRTLARQMAALDSLLRVQGAESRRMWAELDTDGDEVKQRVRQTQAKLDEVARRLADLSKELESVRLYTGSRAASYGRPSSTPVSGDTLGSPGGRASLVSDAQGLYDQASEDMNARDFALAISEFSQLLETFPQSDLADNARYWLGECYRAQKDLPRAIGAFQRVIADYPTSEVIPSAMLKLGYAFLDMREREKGSQQLRALIRTHPDSEEAAQAMQRLKSLGGAPKGGTQGKRR